jgi:hypothetical protein
MTPCDIHIKGGPPLVGTFGKIEKEFAAGLLVLVCQLDGDEWRPVYPNEVGTVCKLHIEDVKEYAWIEFALGFAPPNFDGLIEQGDAEFVGDEEDIRKRPVQFTAQGLDKLAKSYWHQGKK